MARQRLRIFVSSPGDVMSARERAAQIIEKVAHEYARFFDIEPYLWEYEPMLASGHFQDSIDPPSRFDAVILILESRLGTPMPERTAVREYHGMDGRTPVTGTEWEFEDALVAARARGVPALLVYRSLKRAEVDTWDPNSRDAVLKQIEALNAFWSRHFADRGTFIGGYATFKTLEEFAGKLEQDLRNCVQRRAEALKPEQRTDRVRLWPSSPFRGLEAYEFEHAPIFFGREEAIGAALLRLVTNAEAGRPFLLVLGASGSGKSSLVKAGVLPRLLVPQRVSGVAFLRRAVFRPGDAQPDEDLFEALARRLTEGDGESTGLPELLGASMTVRELGRHLRESTAHPDLAFAMVLDRLAETARDQGRMLRYEQPRLILEVDQLEELFTSERVQPEERQRFVRLLAGLVSSRLVWLIASMRADFWHRALETPELAQLADSQARMDLLAPTPAELSQMIRGPAEASAIHFETSVATGIPLNDLIAQEAAGEPGALPLLSYLLGQLYQRDIQQAAGDTLTYASYNALGGLKGAIATRADAVMAAQPAEVQQALRSVLFALVQMTPTERGVERAAARRAPLADFPEGTPKRRLIEALTDGSARLLVADSTTGQAATVRLAHEALINEWQTARSYVADNAEALKTRRMLEERCARWQKLTRGSRVASAAGPGSLITVLRAPFAPERGLLTDLDLTEAQGLVEHYGQDLPHDLIAYFERSIGRGRRKLRRVVVVVTLGLLCAGVAIERAALRRAAVLNWHAGQILVCGSCIPLGGAADASLRTVVDNLASTMRNDLVDPGTRQHEPWPVAQAAVAVQGMNVAYDAAAVLDSFDRLQDPDCNCWQEVPKRYLNSTADEKGSSPPNIVATGWVLLAKAGLHSPASSGTTGFLTRTQSAEGWWAVFELSPENSAFASPYATGWALAGLHAQRDANLLSPELVSRTDGPLAKAGRWLLRAESSPSSARWRFYPNDTSSNESAGLSGFVLHVLHAIGTPKADLERIDRDWLRRLPDQPPEAGSLEQTLTLIDTPAGTTTDHFQQVVLPWMIIATVDAYRDGGVWDRARAATWLEEAVTSPSVRNAHENYAYWWRAELLYSLRYLCTRLDTCRADQRLPGPTP